MKMKSLLLCCAAAVAVNALGGAYAQSASAPDMSKYILTPASPETPRINGAKIFGVRPSSQFLFTVAATGVRPMTFSADGLPKGLKIDCKTGRITGVVKEVGTYDVTLHADNAKGSATRALRIVVGDEISLTPPMGWNSWNCWGNSVSQEKVLSSARAMAERGLINHGWTYINIDDGWQGVRGGKYNAIQCNQKFPDMKRLADDIHKMGLKIGIYSGPWVGTYAGHVGSYADEAGGTYYWVKDGRHNENFKLDDPAGKIDRKTNWHHGKYSFVDADAKQFGDWDIDYLKYDWNPNDVYHAAEMLTALRALDRDVVYSLSNSAPYGDAPQWMKYCNCWRTTGDIRDTWESMSSIGFAQDKWLPFNRPGHWADPDMLVVGMVGWGPKLHYTKLTADEQYTHISLWALLAAPMLIGCDMAQMDDFTFNLLCNDEVNDVNQDILGLQAVPVWSDSDGVIYVKHLDDGSMAVGLFNKSASERDMSFTLKMIGLRGAQTVRDLWRQKDLGECKDKFSTTVAPHGVTLVKVYPGNSREQATEGR